MTLMHLALRLVYYYIYVTVGSRKGSFARTAAFQVSTTSTALSIPYASPSLFLHRSASSLPCASCSRPPLPCSSFACPPPASSMFRRMK